jgi:DNA-binding NarL/FixJ family response regulator
MTKPRLLLADDHWIIMEGLKSLLEPEFELAGMVEDGRALVEAAGRLKPDVIVADISMPGLNGIEAVRQIMKARGDVKVVILTMHADSAYAAAAIDAGATGYVLKHAAASELITAVRTVLQGENYLSPLITGELKLQGKETGTHQQDENSLTSRQREVLQLLAEGNPIKEIASVLNISTRTVEFHKYQMMECLGIKSAAELVRFAVRNRIVAEY